MLAPAPRPAQLHANRFGSDRHIPPLFSLEHARKHGRSVSSYSGGANSSLMGNTPSQPDLSQRDRLQSRKSTSRVRDSGAQQTYHGVGSLPYSAGVQEVPETQLQAEQADDIAASSQLQEESLRWMENGTANGGEGSSGHARNGDAVTEEHPQRKRKREDEGGEKRRKKRKRKSEDGSGAHDESLNGTKDHAMQVDMVTGELPAHVKTNGASHRKEAREKSIERVDGGDVGDSWMLQLDGAADKTLREPVPSKALDTESSKKAGKERKKHISSQNIGDVAAEIFNPTKSEKRTSAQSSTAQRNAASEIREENGVLASPWPADNKSLRRLKDTGRKFSHVQITSVRPTEDGKASASGVTLPTDHYDRTVEAASGLVHDSVRAQAGSQARMDKPDKKAKKLAKTLARLDQNTQHSSNTHAGVTTQSAPKERRGLTPKWTAVNHDTPIGVKSTVQKRGLTPKWTAVNQHTPICVKSTVHTNHVDHGTITHKQDIAQPVSKPNWPAKEPSMPAVAGTPGKRAKQKKSPKSKEFIVDSDVSDTEEPSQTGISWDSKKAHVVAPPQVQTVATSKKESKKHGKSHRMQKDEGGQRANEPKKIASAVGFDNTMDDAAKTTTKSNRKGKRTTEEDDQYAIPLDSDDDDLHTAQPKSIKSASHNYASRRSDQVQAREIEDVSAEKVKGPFNQSEISVLSQYFTKYKTEHSLDQRSMNEMIQNTERSNDTKAFWDAIADLLPNRPRKSLQRFCRRQWHNYQSSGLWSPEEDEILAETYAFKPNKWVYIGGVVGRRPEDCRDRWRNVVKLGDRRREGGWMEEEEQRLRRAVEECAKAMMDARRKSGVEESQADAEAMELLDWNVVSDKMAGTRSRQQCADKWKRMMRDKEITTDPVAAAADIESAGKAKSKSAGWRKERARKRYKIMLAGDKYDILKAVGKSGTVNVNNIRWSIVRELLGGRDCMWDKHDLEYAFSVIKRKAGLDRQEGKLGLKKTVKKMKRYLKGKFAKKAARRRFVDTEEGKRVKECGWSAKTPEKRRTVVQMLEDREDEDVDDVSQDEVVQQNGVQDEGVDDVSQDQVVQDHDVQDGHVEADQTGVDDQEEEMEVNGQEAGEPEVDQEVAEQDALSPEVDSVLSADDYT